MKTATPPPSPPPPPPPRMQTAEEDIPIVFGEALPAAASGAVSVCATACEVVVNVDESNDTVASSYAVPASHNNHYNNNISYANNDNASRYSYPASVMSTPADPYGYPSQSNHYGGASVASAAPSMGYSSYAPPVSQIHVPASSGATVSTSPMSIRSTYSGATNAYLGVPAPPQRRHTYTHNIEMLRSSAMTTAPMTTNTGVQLQQLSMVNMQGRRMTPYVTKPRNNNMMRAATTGSVASGGNSVSSYQSRPGSRMTRYA